MTADIQLPVRPQPFRWRLAAATCVALACLCAGLPAGAQNASQGTNQNPDRGQSLNRDSSDTPAGSTGPIRLRQSSQGTGTEALGRQGTQEALQPSPATTGQLPTALGDFELYVRSQVGGRGISRFGTELLTGAPSPGDALDYNPLVPPDYILRAGDELVLTVWGSLDADLRLQVDRSGRITIPRVGPVMVSGVRYSDLPDVIAKRIGQVFKNFQLSVSLGQLRGIRVYVTGFVDRPGSLTLNSLSTVAQALMKAGGPSAAGSFRQIQLRRGKETVATFDLYDLLLKGDRSGDSRLEADDVIHVGAVGPLVAVLGSVNRPSIFELKPDETVGDVLRMAGGLSAVADRRRLAWEPFADRGKSRVSEIDLATGLQQRVGNGDVLRAFNLGDVVQPMGNQNKRVRIEGEVARPGEYVLPPGSTIADALRESGGTTANAYLYAAEFTRESVLKTQQKDYERALRDFETQLTANAATRRAATTDEANQNSASNAANRRLLEQLRALKPTGRIVLQAAGTTSGLPDMVLEDGDRLYIPKRPNTVSVFGSVFSSGSYLHKENRTVGDYLQLAGGPTKGADESSVFVIRSNGTVNSSLQQRGFFSRGNGIGGLPIEPGDTIFVPEELDKATFVQIAKDWSQIFFQLAVGLAGLKTSTGL